MIPAAVVWAVATFGLGALAGNWKGYVWWVMSGAAGIFFTAWGVMEGAMWEQADYWLLTIFGTPAVPAALHSFMHLLGSLNSIFPVVEVSLVILAIISLECIVAGIAVYMKVVEWVGLFAPTGG